MTQPASPARTILLVDDDELVRKSVARFLSAYCRVVVAPTARAALDIVAAETLYAVVTDVRLGPGGPESGIDVLEATRRVQPHARRILWTGGELPRNASEVSHAILVKPVGPDALIDVLSLRCSRRDPDDA